jgi:hypothetical protein
MRPCAAALLLATLLVAAEPTTAPPTTASAPVDPTLILPALHALRDGLRNGSLTNAYHRAPPALQADLAQRWDDLRRRMTPADDVAWDAWAEAADDPRTWSALVLRLRHLLPDAQRQSWIADLQLVRTRLAVAIAADPAGSATAQAAQRLVGEVAPWFAAAPLNDPERREAIAYALAQAWVAAGAPRAAQLRGDTYGAWLGRLDAAQPHLRHALRAAAIDLDGILTRSRIADTTRGPAIGWTSAAGDTLLWAWAAGPSGWLILPGPAATGASFAAVPTPVP